MTVTIVDSGICNLGSVSRSVERAGGDVSIATTPEEVVASARIILPGVGSFPAGMQALNERGLANAIRDFASAGKPVLGICLGMQLLFESGKEFVSAPGLGLIPGYVRELNSDGQTLPHMGWNDVNVRRKDPLVDDLPDDAFFYFVHSFVCEPDEPEDVLTTTDYGESFCSIVQHKNIRGIQAHPEKSQRCGAQLLKNFLQL